MPSPYSCCTTTSVRPEPGQRLQGAARGRTYKIVNLVLRRIWSGQFGPKPCSHLHIIRPEASPASQVCQECVRLGDTWPALRMCLTCGHIGCCDKAKNRHADKHFPETGHPLIRPYKERGMNWVWCYVDAALLDPL